MTEEQLDLFPVSVGKYVLDHATRSKLKDICFKYINDSTLAQPAKRNGVNFKWRSSPDENLFNFDEFKWFEEIITKLTCEYIENILGYELKDGVVITDSWLNVYHSNQNQFMHNHSNSFVSGTYYVNFDPNVHGQLTFQYLNFLPGMNSSPFIKLNTKKQTKYNSGVAIINHAEGDLLLWQSHLTHGFANNMADNRISISFNAVPQYLCSKSYSFRVIKE